jgi:eukaryotic translation initiation factor 2C
MAGAGADDAASDVDLAPVSKKGLAHPARPALATVGRNVFVRANHFLVHVADNNLFHYDVS